MKRTPEQLERNRELQRIRDQTRRPRERRAKAEAKRATIKLARMSSAEAVALYRLEKAASDARNAARRADELARVKAAIARAESEREEGRRGGRPKRMPALNLTTDRANALVNALRQPWTGE